MQDRRCGSSTNTAGVLPRLGFSQDLPEISDRAATPVKEEHLCTKAFVSICSQWRGREGFPCFGCTGRVRLQQWDGEDRERRKEELGENTEIGKEEAGSKKESKVQPTIQMHLFLMNRHVYPLYLLEKTDFSPAATLITNQASCLTNPNLGLTTDSI